MIRFAIFWGLCWGAALISENYHHACGENSPVDLTFKALRGDPYNVLTYTLCITR